MYGKILPEKERTNINYVRRQEDFVVGDGGKNIGIGMGRSSTI